jgi:predicted lipoprotein with Yx(FWY)xxD motif
MRPISVLAVGLVGAMILVGTIYLYEADMQTETAFNVRAPLATPPGVTYQTAQTGKTVFVAMAGKQFPVTASVYADANGMTLYTFDNDVEASKPACVGDCAKLWPALPAPAGAKPFGEWTPVTRDDGSKQWALRARPLYRYSQDAKPGEGGGNGRDGAWHIAEFTPGEGYKLPNAIKLAESASAASQVLTNEQGMPLYTFDDDRSGGRPNCVTSPCTDHWSPYLAGQLAKPINTLTIVDRGDGLYQWAFKGKPLYSYDGDVEPGDANGDGVDGRWHAAAVFRNFMPDGIVIARNRFGGRNLAMTNGRPLYIRDRVVGTENGQNLRIGSRGRPKVGQILGTAACDAECTETWHIFAAPADAQGSGDWGVVTRDDGTKQWVYRGYPVYSFTGDTKPGDMLGNETYQIMGENDPFTAADLVIKSGVGELVWRILTP